MNSADKPPKVKVEKVKERFGPDVFYDDEEWHANQGGEGFGLYQLKLREKEAIAAVVNLTESPELQGQLTS